MSVYEKRREKIYAYLEEKNIDLFVIEDTEGRRSPSLRYLSGHPADALLFLCRTGKAALFPWDAIMAAKYAEADEILPYNEFGRRPREAITGFLRKTFTGDAASAGREKLKIALPAAMPYPAVTQISEEIRKEFPSAEILCGNDGPDAFITKLRMIKDSGEITCLRKAASILNTLLEGIEKGIRSGSLITETDLALFIEKECRVQGAEGTSFATLAAGPRRSFGIHAFPGYTAAPFVSPGLSILDFGVSYEGYAGDVTLTLATGKLSSRQEELVRLVEEAYHAALGLCRPGESTVKIARAVEDIFARRNLVMPHSLGHGLGLEVHEAPFLRTSEDADTILAPGMIFTLEPGLYDAQAGGVRWENDVLITETGREVLTRSKILYLPEVPGV
jgi:Xaa-Pro dipeptidase